MNEWNEGKEKKNENYINALNFTIHTTELKREEKYRSSGNVLWVL